MTNKFLSKGTTLQSEPGPLASVDYVSPDEGIAGIPCTAGIPCIPVCPYIAVCPCIAVIGSAGIGI
jgi:hypothetical protein